MVAEPTPSTLRLQREGSALSPASDTLCATQGSSHAVCHPTVHQAPAPHFLQDLSTVAQAQESQEDTIKFSSVALLQLLPVIYSPLEPCTGCALLPVPPA